ncbi:hypothetical protein [Nannocystis sp. SCPEA4]|uniref:hypothetical protein n=1 Tax=Nannocystis sp. SCPEA4 TaxID=2996787 RepID=UPI002271F751|nr:hypothetical protein [Nannocystis sp. SCPEA4]MCY1061706.1 hypothetical protein [Nannocystis sp. SCPEA4]
MSVNLEFSARVGKWPREREDEVLAALKAWAYEDESFDEREVLVDILGGGPRNPIVRMEAYTTGPIIISRFGAWHPEAEARLRKRVEEAGGSDVSLKFTFPDDA